LLEALAFDSDTTFRYNIKKNITEASDQSLHDRALNTYLTDNPTRRDATQVTLMG